MLTAREYLENLYDNCVRIVGNNDTITTALNAYTTEKLDVVLKYSESAKAVLTVLITSLVYKHLNPAQDIRNHQDSITDGYSGRGFDTKNITPFLKEHKFPAMRESGWLTRSLEQKQPYTLNYTGAITPSVLKQAFLELIDGIQNGANCNLCLEYLIQGLILQRNKQQIDLAKPISLPIFKILDLLNQHFTSHYTA